MAQAQGTVTTTTVSDLNLHDIGNVIETDEGCGRLQAFVRPSDGTYRLFVMGGIDKWLVSEPTDLIKILERDVPKRSAVGTI